jgi:HD-GYP domain-containing protein (c-di-GMP phosphodiesterase class II)
MDSGSHALPHGRAPSTEGSAPSGVRLAEVMASLSLATDLAMGQPLEYALCSCLLAVRLGVSLGLSETDRQAVYYQALLRYIGCNAETNLLAALVGDEHALRHDFAAVDTANPAQVIPLVLRYIRQAHQGASPLSMASLMARGILEMPRMTRESFAGHCEVAERLATRIGFGPTVVQGLGQLYERWDGKGLPHGLKGEALTVAVRVVALAQDAIVFQRLGGIDAAIEVARQRSGSAYDPYIAQRFVEHAPRLLEGLDGEPTWDAVLASEPGVPEVLSNDGLDAACAAMADFADLKSPSTLGHSTGVALLAETAARHAGLPADEILAVRRAGWLHDIGQVGVSSSIWEKAGPLTDRDWERVRLHAYHTERVLARPAALARLGGLASLHHERLDASGYHRGLAGGALPPAARLLAAADVYHALTEPRPHRSALRPEAAAEELRREVRAGRLDGAAADAVLAAAGHRVRRTRHELVAGLSEREIEVLRLIARGHTMKEMAAQLVVSPKTVDNHIQHIYGKLGVSTRAGATLFAMEQDLLGDLALSEL